MLAKEPTEVQPIGWLTSTKFDNRWGFFLNSVNDDIRCTIWLLGINRKYLYASRALFYFDLDIKSCLYFDVYLPWSSQMIAIVIDCIVSLQLHLYTVYLSNDESVLMIPGRMIFSINSVFHPSKTLLNHLAQWRHMVSFYMVIIDLGIGLLSVRCKSITWTDNEL